jgi:hypothetical protein
VSSGGEFSMSRAFEKAGNTPFVLKGGAVNSVKCFSVNAQAGFAEIINMDRPLNINQSTPATGPTGSVSHLSFNEDNSQLISSVKGTPTDLGYIATNRTSDAWCGSLRHEHHL